MARNKYDARDLLASIVVLTRWRIQADSARPRHDLRTHRRRAVGIVANQRLQVARKKSIRWVGHLFRKRGQSGAASSMDSEECPLFLLDVTGFSWWARCEQSESFAAALNCKAGRIRLCQDYRFRAANLARQLRMCGPAMIRFMVAFGRIARYRWMGAAKLPTRFFSIFSRAPRSGAQKVRPRNRTASRERKQDYEEQNRYSLWGGARLG